MTKEYVYYPYGFRVNPESMPKKLQDLFYESEDVAVDLSGALKRLVLWAQNDLVKPADMIRCTDYCISAYFFPLEENILCWDLFHDLVRNALEECIRQFNKLGFYEKDDMYGEITYSVEPDINQIYTRMTLYYFYTMWYAGDKAECRKMAGYLAEENFYDIACLADKNIENDPFENRTDEERINYLTEITNWLSMESGDGRYGELALVYYDEMLGYFKRFSSDSWRNDLYDRLLQVFLADYRDVLNNVISESEEAIYSLNEKIDIKEAMLDHYEALLSKCDQEILSMKGERTHY